MKKNLLYLLAATIMTPAFSLANEIPVDRVILSTSGLANFEHKAHIEDNAKVEFPVRLEQVDDILKSLVVFDKKGTIGGVVLPGKQPLTQVFKDLPFTQYQLSSPAALLNAYQGAVVTLKGDDINITGKLLQAVPESVVVDKDNIVTKNRVSVMTDDGIKQALLEDASSVQFVDEKIRNEVSRALDAIRVNSAVERRTLSVNLQGKGERDVTLSYVVDAPLWKTAYRMVVPEAGGTKGFLQGWAVVENMTASDWKNVDLTLVSGNPVTFRQALYESYYVDRPEIPVQVFGRVMPRIDEGTQATAEEQESDRRYDMALAKKESIRAGKMKVSGGMAAAAPEPAMMMDSIAAYDGGYSGGYNAPAEASYDVNDLANASSAAMSAEATAQVLFRFPNRFDLAAGQSMMLPFVSSEVPMERVSLYQPDTNAKHPLSAVEIENTGGVSLPQGVLTLYEESKLLNGVGFAGDAQMPMLSAGEKRLVSYALDSKTDVDREDKSASTEDKISISQGVIRTSVKNKSEAIYTIKAPAKEDRTVIIEHPKMGDYKLVSPDPKTVEVTDKYYRIKLSVKAGDKKVMPVVLENEIWQSWGIVSLPTDQLLSYATSRGNLDAKTRQAFKKMADIRRDIDVLDQKISQLDYQRQVIFTDQDRVRENLKSLTSKSEIQEKYLEKLNKQEERIGKIDTDRETLSSQRDARQAELSALVAGLEF